MPVGASAQGARAGGFRPDQISSLSHWYDATKLSGFADGNSIGTWPDEEGGDDLTQATGSKQPTYQTGVIGGNPIGRFDGTDDVISGGFGSTLSQPNTIITVAQARTAAEDATEAIHDGIATGNRQLLDSRNNASSNEWRVNAGSNLGTGTSEDANAHIFAVEFNGSNTIVRLDATQIGSGDAGSHSLTGLTLGSSFDEAAPGDFDIGEVLVYNAALSTADRDSVESYLSGKWGITI